MTTDQPDTTIDSELDDVFRRLEERVEYNRHDMGEMGMFIRVGYVKNFLEDTKQELEHKIAQEANKARLDELERMPEAMTFSELLEYFNDRIAQLTARGQGGHNAG